MVSQRDEVIESRGTYAVSQKFGVSETEYAAFMHG